MKRTVGEVANLCGISVRTLHYYDEIGLLQPSNTSEAGYRIYTDGDLERLWQILFFRDLGFSLQKIKAMLGRPDYNKNEALSNHRELLRARRAQLDAMLRLVDEHLKGEQTMNEETFDMSSVEAAKRQYAKEAEERWGKTEAYRESMKRTSAYSKADWAKISTESDDILKTLASAMDKSPDDLAVSKNVARWQAHITQYYYPCTTEILAGLGEMYISDERFAKNLNRYGQGFAEFLSRAIKAYCEK